MNMSIPLSIHELELFSIFQKFIIAGTDFIKEIDNILHIEQYLNIFQIDDEYIYFFLY